MIAAGARMVYNYVQFLRKEALRQMSLPTTTHVEITARSIKNFCNSSGTTWK